MNIAKKLESAKAALVRYEESISDAEKQLAYAEKNGLSALRVDAERTLKRQKAAVLQARQLIADCEKVKK